MSPSRLGVGQPLQHHDAHAFARNEAVGALIEGEALALGREHARLRRLDVHLRPGHHIDAAGQRQIAGAGDQAVTGLGDGDQRGRAGRVDGDAGALQVQEVGDARRQDGRRAAREALRAQLMLARQLVIVAGGAADEDAALAPGQARARRSRRSRCCASTPAGTGAAADPCSPLRSARC